MCKLPQKLQLKVVKICIFKHTHTHTHPKDLKSLILPEKVDNGLGKDKSKNVDY